MITPGYVRTMAAYNAEMNRRLYGAAARLSEEERRAARGGFWGSIHGTLTHILWAHEVDDAWLGEDMVWFSGAANREVRAPKGLLVTHFFNHQTHHRGQAHAMLTAAGQETGDTDLFLLVPQIVD